MNRSPKIVSRQLIIVLGILMTSLSTIAQKESKTYKETFNVDKDAVLDINTSYADIEFETWDKNVVEVVATVELEGAEKEEAEKYLENNPIKILGNSSRIEITSSSNKFISFEPQDFEFDFKDLDIEIPEIAPFVVEIPEIAPFPEVVEVPPMPPLPQTDAFKFDYEAYQKDGEKYMKKWQKEFKKSFDEKHQKRLEEWAKRMEERGKVMEERLAAQEEIRGEMEKRQEEMEKKREEMMEKRVESREAMQEAREAQRKAEREVREKMLKIKKSYDGPNVFYFSSDGENKNYKIKKTIKIKMPKSAKIKMNVRHGEVKLAENTKNLNATLSHSSLWATTIDGDETQVSVSYSPVNVQNWNYGKLRTNYSKDIELSEVHNLQLQANSSDVTINKLLKKAFIKNDFGPLKIVSVSNDFEEVDVSLKNAELTFKLPSTATKIYIKGTASEVTYPKTLKLKETKNGNTTVFNGYNLAENNGRSIVITSDFSEMTIE